MKLLIVAGPYEADRIRRAAVSAGIEAVAVEPGESLSGWITATRPDVIVLAPQIVSPDPVAALAKVRAVPRGRVPILLVGEPDEQAQLQPLAEGFFVRPVSPDELLQTAREAMARAEPPGVDDPDSGPKAAPIPVPAEGSGKGVARATEVGPGELSTKTPTLRPLVAAREPDGAVPGAETGESSGAKVVLPAPRTGAPTRPRNSSAPRRRAPTMFDRLAEHIDADFDAEIRDVVRAVGTLRRFPTPGPRPAIDLEATYVDPVEELKEERDQKTLVVPESVRATLFEEERGRLGADRVGRPPRETTPVPDEVDLDLPSLLARMYLSRLSGRLTLRQGKTTKFIVFERGHPVLAGSTRVGDRMGDMLVRQGRFTAAEIAGCGAEVASSGRRLGVVLVERGLLKATELSALVRRHYEEIIYSLFAWERGAWNLGTDSSVAAEKILLSQHPAALILEGIRRKFSADRSATGLGGVDRVFRLRLTTGAADLLEKMETTSEERNLVLLFDGVRSLREIQALTRAPAQRLYGVAWALFVLERLNVVETAPVKAAPPGDAGSGLVLPERDESIDRALVQSRYALVEQGDYFQILGVPRDASAYEILRAHETLVAELASDVLHPSVATDFATELMEIHAVLAEAAGLLADEGLRRRYRDHLPPPRTAEPSAGAAV